MNNKEEYTLANLREHCIKTMQFSNRNSNTYKEHELTLSSIDENISLKYKIDQLESNNQKLIEKLEKDIVNITKSMHNGKYLDDYRRCRLKAYKTKTKEILEILKGEKE